MPLTVIDIERRKNWRIWLFFLLLMLLYFVIAALFALPFSRAPWHAGPRFWLSAAMIALPAAAIHFRFSAYDTVGRLLRDLNAQPPDANDDIHAMFSNIVEEIHVATGNKRKISCAVIPSLSLNALSAADLKGEAVIGITEGLLSRLTRPQLEAVIAHEAHHILSGDCVETTVASGLFGLYASGIEKMSDTSQGRTFSSPAVLLAWVLLKLGYLLNMFISREREYRADAAAVRMTRNPVALAETLYLLSRSWSGAGFIGSGCEMLCIINPQATALDEADGFFADLLSTHPPIRKRIDVLLAMARVSIAELEKKTAKKTENGSTSAGPAYYAMDPQQQWQGPFTMNEMGVLPWLSPLTWVTSGGNRPAGRAWKEPAINAIFASRVSEKEPASSGLACPVCRQQLLTSSYEGTQVFHCRYCAGTLVEIGKIPRIIARTGREAPCSERITALARTVVKENQIRRIHRVAADKKSIPLLSCPQCHNSMYRGFYSLAQMIEIDRCTSCGVIWFDRDELEMLQCLIENKIEPELGKLQPAS